MKVLELFAGVGGYHITLKQLLPGFRSSDVRPYDNNLSAVKTYEMNFGTKVNRTNIEHIQLADAEGFDLWAMSPPCQPHTLTSMSLQQDAADHRSAAFQHVCRLLDSVVTPPTQLICENVPGFVTSDQFKLFTSVLSRRNYTWQVCLCTQTVFLCHWRSM